MPPLSEQEMNAHLAEESRVSQVKCNFTKKCALHKFTFIVCPSEIQKRL